MHIVQCSSRNDKIKRQNYTIEVKLADSSLLDEAEDCGILMYGC